MPRSGWLAIGGVLTALMAGAGDPRLIAVSVVVAGLLLIAGSWLPRGRRLAVVALALGMLSIGIRANFGPHAATLAGIPVGNGPWSMVVESVGSPREGEQVATLRTVDGGTTGFRLAATLPR